MVVQWMPVQDEEQRHLDHYQPFFFVAVSLRQFFPRLLGIPCIPSVVMLGQGWDQCPTAKIYIAVQNPQQQQQYGNRFSKIPTMGGSSHKGIAHCRMWLQNMAQLRTERGPS